MMYIVILVVCTIILFAAWTAMKEAELIEEQNSAILEEENRQNRFAIEQYNRNRPVKLHVKTIEELKEKLKKK